MKTASCKAKGRRCAQEVKELLHAHAPSLELGDIVITPSGVPGADLHLSPLAKRVYPLSIECKNVEKINIWQSLEQAEAHAEKNTQTIPSLFFKKNRSALYVALRAEDFLRLLQEGKAIRIPDLIAEPLCEEP